jgi:hypothetical protein
MYSVHKFGNYILPESTGQAFCLRDEACGLW